MKISGYFEMDSSPLRAEIECQGGNTLERFKISKTFYGSLKANAQGEMLKASTNVEGSSGHVALEQVVGNLCGREGSFLLQHLGAHQSDHHLLILRVVPDSGTGEMEGLTGKMSIRASRREQGEHKYEFDFEWASS
ncbi:MAG: DUF3224 domain-containing protein [Oceanobacter sp.]